MRLLLAYDGTDFRGWAAQRDPRIRTVEGALLDVLRRVTGERPRLSVAGRTDAGVHARGQVASFVAASGVHPQQVADAINGILGPEVVARGATVAPDGFDARFSATAREYRFRHDTSEVADPFTARFTWHRPGELSTVRMRAAARLLVGEHDFASFCRRPPGGAATRRRLTRLSVAREDGLIVVTARADSFLHQMVRSIVGTLVAVGEGRIEPGAIPRTASPSSA